MPQLRRPAKEPMFFALVESLPFVAKKHVTLGAASQVGLLLDCLRCSAGQYLSDPCVWHMATCLRNNVGSSRGA